MILRTRELRVRDANCAVGQTARHGLDLAPSLGRSIVAWVEQVISGIVDRCTLPLGLAGQNEIYRLCFEGHTSFLVKSIGIVIVLVGLGSDIGDEGSPARTARRTLVGTAARTPGKPLTWAKVVLGISVGAIPVAAAPLTVCRPRRLGTSWIWNRWSRGWDFAQQLLDRILYIVPRAASVGRRLIVQPEPIAQFGLAGNAELLQQVEQAGLDAGFPGQLIDDRRLETDRRTEESVRLPAKGVENDEFGAL